MITPRLGMSCQISFILLHLILSALSLLLLLLLLLFSCVGVVLVQSAGAAVGALSSFFVCVLPRRFPMP